LKKDNFEWVTQKTTEIGVSKIVPVISQRTIKLDVKIDRLKKIIREAAEQSELAYVPTLEEPTSFRKALDNARSCNEVFFCDASGESLKNAKLEQSGEVAIFIGPEGGWTEAEIEIARKAGFKISSLGNSILRGETAAIAASFAVSSLL
jgi:16S rRNA (uracil1498-N3)-methyltransferase